MDDARDMKKTDQLAKYLDEQSIRIKVFGRNISAERAYNRAERVIAALHLLTAHVSANEPARRVARKTGLRLLESLLQLRDELRVPNSEVTASSMASIRELISTVRVLAISGYISIQNAEVITSALDDLGMFLTSAQKSPLSENVSFSKEELTMERAQPEIRPRFLRTEPVLTDVPDIKDITDKTQAPYGTAIIGSRAQSILDVLRTGGELGIGVISAQLPEYSEKMIQRELANLVRLGKVKKMGFKRWSRYSLA